MSKPPYDLDRAKRTTVVNDTNFDSPFVQKMLAEFRARRGAIQELDSLTLTDGQHGTVVAVYAEGAAYEVETADGLVTVRRGDIAAFERGQ